LWAASEGPWIKKNIKINSNCWFSDKPKVLLWGIELEVFILTNYLIDLPRQKGFAPKKWFYSSFFFFLKSVLFKEGPRYSLAKWFSSDILWRNALVPIFSGEMA
jgi:hypothetical protein